MIRIIHVLATRDTRRKVDEMLSLYPIIYYDIAFSSAFIRNFLALFMTFSSFGDKEAPFIALAFIASGFYFSHSSCELFF